MPDRAEYRRLLREAARSVDVARRGRYERLAAAWLAMYAETLDA